MNAPLPQKYECISVGNAIIGNELVTEFGNAGTLGMLGHCHDKLLVRLRLSLTNSLSFGNARVRVRD